MDLSKQMFCTCVCFPVISGLFSQTPPDPHPIPYPLLPPCRSVVGSPAGGMSATSDTTCHLDVDRLGSFGGGVMHLLGENAWEIDDM